MSNSEIKQCPFCGDDAVVIKVKAKKQFDVEPIAPHYYLVGCQADFSLMTGCHIFRSDWSEESAIAKWNNRIQ